MGNGFTFPLETLIFWALAACCVRPEDVGKVSVYGDDIIVPTYAYALLTEVLVAAGFLVNSKKSFVDGPFRESCGRDYLSGIDIRPSYIKDALSGSTLFVLHNFYVRTMQPDPAAMLLNYIDPSIQIWGPDGYGDGHLLGAWNPRPHGRENGWAGYLFDTFTFKARKSIRPYKGDAVLPLYTVYAPMSRRGFHGGLPPRDPE
jgi:hypothetical protein